VSVYDELTDDQKQELIASALEYAGPEIRKAVLLDLDPETRHAALHFEREGHKIRARRRDQQ
jgi:hypothetical protein